MHHFAGYRLQSKCDLPTVVAYVNRRPWLTATPQTRGYHQLQIVERRMLQLVEVETLFGLALVLIVGIFQITQR
jgi:hypothetical protein